MPDGRTNNGGARAGAGRPPGSKTRPGNPVLLGITREMQDAIRGEDWLLLEEKLNQLATLSRFLIAEAKRTSQTSSPS
jgi:hypothetical protein